MQTIQEISGDLYKHSKGIHLIYAFNRTGKTRISRNLKENHPREVFYFNAYTEDLFKWDNCLHTKTKNYKVDVVYSALNEFHSNSKDFTEKIQKYLKLYDISLKFQLNYYPPADVKKGIKNIEFLMTPFHKRITVSSTGQTSTFNTIPNNIPEKDIQIKISRAEERLFIWCFFLACFDQTLNEEYVKIIFIDDPISSLDDNNTIKTSQILASKIKEAVKQKKKLIITTHMPLLYNTLNRRLNTTTLLKSNYRPWLLEKSEDGYRFSKVTNNFYYHIWILKKLKSAKDDILPSHIPLLRQLLEFIAAFTNNNHFNDIVSSLNLYPQEQKLVRQNLNPFSHYDNPDLRVNTLPETDKKTYKKFIDQLIMKYNFNIK